MYPGVELRLLRYVIAVAEELHFSRAAAKVRVAQPSLSKQIRDLEEEIGAQLFDRTHRDVRLTAAGRVFVKEAEKALVHSDRAVRLAREADPARDGELRLGYTPGMNLRLLSAIRRLLAVGQRTAKTSFHSLSTLEQATALLEGSLAAGIVTLPFQYESLAFEPILREPLAAALRENSEGNGPRQMAMARLSGIPLICKARRLNSQAYDHLLKELRRAGYAPPSIVEVTNEWEALHMVRDGLGVAFVKASALPFPADSIGFFQLTDADLVEDTGLAYQRSNRAKNLREFLEAIRSHTKELALQSLPHASGNFPGDASDPRQLKLF